MLHLPVSLAGPGRSGGAPPIPALSGPLPPSPASPGSGPQLQWPAATGKRRSPFITTRYGASWRTRTPRQNDVVLIAVTADRTARLAPVSDPAFAYRSTDRALPGLLAQGRCPHAPSGVGGQAGSPGGLLPWAAKPALMGTIGHKDRALDAPLVTRALGADVMPGRKTCLYQRLHGRIVASRAATLTFRR
jgi:hypothetical protein